MTNIFSWIGFREQRQVLVQARDHVEQVSRAVDQLQQAIGEYARGALAECKASCDRVENSEKQADEIRRELLRGIAEGMFLPPDREDLIHLVERMDDIADHACAAARLIILLRHPVDPDIKERLVQFTSLLQAAVGHLGQALSALYRGEVEAALEACNQVEAKEEEADRQKSRFLEILFTRPMEAGALLLLRELIEALENTADKTEDSADLVRLLSVKYGKR